MSLCAKPLMSKAVVVLHVTKPGALSSFRIRRADMHGGGSDVSTLEGDLQLPVPVV